MTDYTIVTNFFNDFGIMIGVLGSLLAIFFAARSIEKKIDKIKDDVTIKICPIETGMSNLHLKQDSLDKDIREFRQLLHNIDTRLAAIRK